MSNVLLDRLRPEAKAVMDNHPVADLPTVDIIMATMRPEYKERFVAQINSQTVHIGRVVISPQGYTEEDIQYLKDNIHAEVVIVPVSEPMDTLGERHNKLTLQTTADWVAIFDDDDLYYPNYLHGQMAQLMETNGKVTAKATVVCHHLGMDKVGFLLPQIIFVKNQRGMGGTIVFHKDVYIDAGGFRDLTSGYDMVFLRDAYLRGYDFGPGDPFNYVVTRGVAGGHTWYLDDNDLGDVRFNSISIDEVEL